MFDSIKRPLLGTALLSSMMAVAAIAPSHSLADGTDAIHYRPVCGPTAPGYARCFASVVTDSQDTPLVSTSAPPSGAYGPAQLHGAYNLPCKVGGSGTPYICPTPGSYGGQTIALVDAYNAPTIQADLNTYDSYYHLPPCTTANGCLTIRNQSGNPSPLPPTDAHWAVETSMDVETAHEICQTCKILLVEASTNSLSDLGAAVNRAVALGATEVSNSYGSTEFSGETAYDSFYHHSGVAITASTGDYGYNSGIVEYPAASPHVVAVGGTTLHVAKQTFCSIFVGCLYYYVGESVWPGASSGCSQYETAHSWQQAVADWNQTHCGTSRGVADVSADADPATGAAVYDSTPYLGQSGWLQEGGTSLAAPLIAGVFALAGGISNSAQQTVYSNFTSSNSHDVTTGSTGSCGTIMCKGVPGYDGPTGLGTPNGTGGF
jgi:subtilase family serine protease